MILGPPTRCPFHHRSLSRREFVGATAGLAVGAGFSTVRAQDGSPHTNAEPNPIPGGASPLGILVHHFPVPPPGTPLTGFNELSEITDFNGFVGGVHILGEGTGTGFADPLAFQTDMGFMQGEFVGEDGEHHNRTFVFI